MNETDANPLLAGLPLLEDLPDLDGAILFLEDKDVGGYELTQRLAHLSVAGVFRRVAGVVLGEFSDIPSSDDPADPSIEEVVTRVFSKGPPCCIGFNFSHGETIACIPIGVDVRLNAEEPSVLFGSPFQA